MRSLAVVVSLTVFCSALDAHAGDLRAEDVRDQVSRWTTEPATDSAAPVYQQRRPLRRWNVDLRAAYVQQLEADRDGGGSIDVGRLYTQFRVGFVPRRGPSFAVSLGYRRDEHGFSGPSSTMPANPWGTVHLLSVTVPILVPLSQRWSLRALPTIRTAFEDGASSEDGVAGGGIIGATYRVSRSLAIGPAIGVVTEIEDDPSFFPFVFIDWSIVPGLTLRTGRGLGATLGLGAFLEWEPNACWRFSLGGRADRLRFRLDRNGRTPSGVGEHSRLNMLLSATYLMSRRLEWSVALGASFGNELRIEDRSGNFIAQEDYDTAMSVGFAIRLRL